MTHDELIQQALRNQRHIALETPVESIEDLPDDLLTALVDLQNSEHFKLHGFRRAIRSSVGYTYNGKRVAICSVELLGGNPFVRVRPHNPEKARDYVAFGDTDWTAKVARGALVCVKDETQWWYAVVEGNAVTCEAELKEHGFPALASSPSHVEVRPV